MKKYLYMIAALFGIDYFCKENIEAQKPVSYTHLTLPTIA